MGYNSIILSGLPCSGKTTLANKLSDHYGWPVYSLGGLWRETWKQKYPNGEVSFEDFWARTSLEENRAMNLKAVQIFKEGNIIADTRYAIYADHLPALFVFITAPLDIRSKRAIVSGKYKGTSKEIENLLIKREEDELKMGKDLIGESYDYRDPSLYHLVINSGLLSIEKEFSLVRNLME